MLDFGGMTHHGVGANPGILSNVSSAANDCSRPDVARPDQVRSGLDGRRFVNDDGVAPSEEARVFDLDASSQGCHLSLEAGRVFTIEHAPYGFAHRKSGKGPVLVSREGGEKHRSVGEVAPVHEPSKRLWGMNVMMAQDARW